METKLRKVLILIIVFMMMFSNFGFTIKAIATSDEFQVISNGFFRKDEVKFSGYFENEDGNQTNEVINNAKQRAILKFNIKPQVEGYLKNANIKAVATDGGDLNFRFVSAKNMLDEINQEEEKEDTQFDVKNENKDLSEISAMNEIENTSLENSVNENQASNVINEISNDANEISNSVSKELNFNTVENSIANEISNNTVSNDVPLEEEEEFIDEEEYIKQEQETETEVEKEKLVSDIKLVNDNEISLVNILEDTTLEVVIEFNQKDEINIADLYKEISFRLTGTYINVKLEEVDIAKEQLMNIGWKYSKDIEVTSEYTKFSPFKIGEVTGIIAENKIVLARNIEDSKYLPIKNTNIEIMVPTVNGKMPMSVDVQATKLMATKGQDSGYVEFTNNNWTYDQNEGKIIINVNNDIAGKAKNSLGEDEYVIIYRFDEYTENETVRLDRDVKVTVEEYSAKENSILEKTIDDNVEIQTNKGELITYSISSSEEKINKAKIYANYNSPDAPYETEYTSNIRLNVLTSDMLEELKIDSSKEYFIDKNGTELEASGIKYKKMTFNYNDIKSTLEKGGAVEIYSLEGALIYTLTKDLVKSQDDCTINMNNEPGVIIQVRDVSANGKIDVEITKAIGRPEIDKSIFANFRKIESRITAEVKYANIEERLTLPLIGTSKEFEESYTKATLSINKPNLTTMQENENVELKIELNNDSQKSDLYVNPTFELVYPKHIKEVELESINVIYDSDLTVKHFETYRDGENLKTRIELDGIQTSFIENSMTNGTNIILNARMKIDEYTPRKEDQIKLYYYNEGVSNYQTQTMWKVNKTIPNNILKQTNGFDVALINYQAPVGLIAINGMRNYDGEGSELRSVKQGTMTRQIQRERAEVNTTMDLLVLNNTGNECSDITMLGRVPFKGNKDVITGENLGTNIDVRLVGSIQEDSENSAKATIYYSAKADANKNLNDASNGWTTDVQDMSKVKSYLIVVDGKVEPGAFLKYTYGFVIPENLPYEGKIVGSFGAYYNNITDVAVVYESSSADKVILETEAGPKVEASMIVDIGDGADIKSARYLKYTIRVANPGSVDLENVVIENKKPLYTTICKESSEKGKYVETNDSKLIVNIDVIKAGEVFEKEFIVKTKPKPRTLEEYCQLLPNVEKTNGKYAIIDENNNISGYIEELPEEFYIENKANIKIENLAKEIETNVVKNKLIDSYFDISTELYFREEQQLISGGVCTYLIDVQNISSSNITNVVVENKLAKELTYTGLTYAMDEYVANYDEENNIVNIQIGDLVPKETKKIYIECSVSNMKNVGQSHIENYTTVIADNGIEEKGDVLKDEAVGAELIVTQEVSLGSDNIKECDNFDIIINIKNKGKGNSYPIDLDINIPNEIKILSATGEGPRPITINQDNNHITGKIQALDSGKTTSLVIKAKSNALDDSETMRRVNIDTKVREENIGDLPINALGFNIIDDPNRELTEEERKQIEEQNTVRNPSANDEYKNPQFDKKPDNNSNKNNTTQSNNSSNNTSTNIAERKYKISGEVWADKNNNGIKEEDEERISKVEVYLYKGKNQIKSCTTDSLGQYRFNDIAPGSYSITFKYDGDKYEPTTFKKKDVPDNLNSDVIDVGNGTAATNSINITDGDQQIDVGLKLKDVLDLEVQKFISKAKITTKGKNKTVEYDDKAFAKLEIKSKELKNTSISLEYKIVVTNKGNVDGSVATIKDYLTKDLTFNEKENKNWYLGSDGVVYNDSLKDTIIKPGESKEVKLILNKVMSENNTGTLINKVEIDETSNTNANKGDLNNNVTTQEIIVTVGTGRTIQIAGLIIFIIAAGVILNTFNIVDFKINKSKKIYK